MEIMGIRHYGNYVGIIWESWVEQLLWLVSRQNPGILGIMAIIGNMEIMGTRHYENYMGERVFWKTCGTNAFWYESFCLKTFWYENFWYESFLVRTKTSGTKTFWYENFWYENLLVRKLLVRQLFGTKVSGTKTLWYENFWYESLLVRKLMVRTSFLKICGTKAFWYESFWYESFLVRKRLHQARLLRGPPMRWQGPRARQLRNNAENTSDRKYEQCLEFGVAVNPRNSRNYFI